MTPLGELAAGARGWRWSATTSRPGTGSVKADGTQVKTLWGELAWQLGRAGGLTEAARGVRDRARTPTRRGPIPGTALARR